MRQFTMHPTRYLFIIVMIRRQPRPPWPADNSVYFLDGIDVTYCFQIVISTGNRFAASGRYPPPGAQGRRSTPGVSFFLMHFALESAR